MIKNIMSIVIASIVSVSIMAGGNEHFISGNLFFYYPVDESAHSPSYKRFESNMKMLNGNRKEALKLYESAMKIRHKKVMVACCKSLSLAWKTQLSGSYTHLSEAHVKERIAALKEVKPILPSTAQALALAETTLDEANAIVKRIRLLK